MAVHFRMVHKNTDNRLKMSMPKGRNQSRCAIGVGYSVMMALILIMM
jgi:hypothetical protein